MRDDKLHIAVDLDDVILDFGGGLRHAIQIEYGVVVPPFERWEMHEVLDPIIGRSWWKWMRERDWLWPNFPAVEGAIGSLARLRDQGHYLEIVTSKPEWAEFSVWKWLGKWRPPVNRVTICDMDTRKVDVTEADMMIDDRPKNVNEFAEDGRVGVLFVASHNQDERVHPDVYRARGWQAVLDVVGVEEGMV